MIDAFILHDVARKQHQAAMMQLSNIAALFCAKCG
jgi:hypothetical protein